MPSLLYIHGFNSSSKGTKSQQLYNLMKQLGLLDQLKIPDLHIEPLKAIAQLEQLIVELGRPVLVGSSLGGYYATYLAEKYQLKALLINPVVLSQQLLGSFYADKDTDKDSCLAKDFWATDVVSKVLRATYNSDQVFIDDYVQDLTTLKVKTLTDPNRYQVWLKKSDEVLDYRFAEAWYKDCFLHVDEGGSHGFVDFGQRLPDILTWAGFDPKLWQHIDFSKI